MSRRKQECWKYTKLQGAHSKHLSLHSFEIAPRNVAEMLLSEGLGKWGKGTDFSKIIQLHSYLQTQPQALRGKEEVVKRSRDKESWVGEACLGLYLIILKDSPQEKKSVSWGSRPCSVRSRQRQLHTSVSRCHSLQQSAAPHQSPPLFQQR